MVTSPRWLYSIGKAGEARRILAKFHSSNDFNSPLVDLEMKEIEENIRIDGADSQLASLTLVLVEQHSSLNLIETWWDFRPLFTTRADRYRAYMVMLIGLSP